MQDTTSIGGILRAWRQERGLSLHGLARKAGVGRTTLSYWEAGTYRPSVPELNAVLEALRVMPEPRLAALTMLGAPRAEQSLRQVPESSVPVPPPCRGDLLRAGHPSEALEALPDGSSLYSVDHILETQVRAEALWRLGKVSDAEACACRCYALMQEYNLTYLRAPTDALMRRLGNDPPFA